MNPLLLVLILFALSPVAAMAADTTGVPKFIRIPVFYVTDRNRVDNGKDKAAVQFGRERMHEGLCEHDPFLGVAYCVIKNLENKPECNSWKNRGWEVSTAKCEGPTGITLLPGKDHIEKTANFYESVYKETSQEPEKELYIFAPGYMSTFESGLRSAARLAYYSERPMLLYSWPSKGKFTEYFADEATVEWSQEHFEDMLNNVGKCAERNPPIGARVYAHSMGGRLILRATPVLKANKAVKEISVICPDVDNGVVKHYANKYFDGKQKIIVRLYESKRDEMLRFSQLVHGGYKRFGEDRQALDSLLPAGSDASLTASDITDMKLETPEECAMTKMLKRVQTIDYTDLDVGTVGHRIPVEVLASLSERGCPGAGLKMCMARPNKKTVATVSDSGTVTGGTGSTPPPTAGTKATTPLTAGVGTHASATEDSDGVIRIERLHHRFSLPLLGVFVKYRPRINIWMTKDWSLK